MYVKPCIHTPSGQMYSTHVRMYIAEYVSVSVMHSVFRALSLEIPGDGVMCCEEMVFPGVPITAPLDDGMLIPAGVGCMPP